MTRIFKKFFVGIWLTLAASISIVILTLHLFETIPYAPKLERQKRDIILGLVESELLINGEGAARRFIALSQLTVPLNLEVIKSTSSSSSHCLEKKSPDIKKVLRDDGCYEISVEGHVNSFFNDNALFFLAFAIIASSALAAAVLARYLVKPVALLRDGLSALARGNFENRISNKMPRHRDEISSLAYDLDVTANRLKEFQATQQRLFHDVSHELRSPLSRLQAVVGVLRQSPAKLETMLDRIDREVDRLDALVGEILTLARLSLATNQPLKTQSIDILDVLNDILADAAFEAEVKGVSVTKDVAGTFVADVEGELIYRALENVVRNAIKYTGDGTSVSVECEIFDHLLRIRVVDQGAGVKDTELEHIFQPFSRGSDTQTGVGYGLGLAIARQAVDRHGGQVYASNETAGGLMLLVEIPKHPAEEGTQV